MPSAGTPLKGSTSSNPSKWVTQPRSSTLRALSILPIVAPTRPSACSAANMQRRFHWFGSSGRGLFQVGDFGVLCRRHAETSSKVRLQMSARVIATPQSGGSNPGQRTSPGLLLRHQCPDSEVRSILLHVLMRTSESKDTEKFIILVPL